MKRWFLSYHAPDETLAKRFKTAIEEKDPDSRVFFAPTHLQAGGFWQAQLAKEIAEATAFILLVGEAGVGDWQVPEYDEALDKSVRSGGTFPLILVLLQGQDAPRLPFLRQFHWIVTPDPTAELDLTRILDATAGRGVNSGELWRYASPYRGLEAMEEKDSDYFFGRQRETVETLAALARAPDRLPILIGNSGVGKSSLAQAGVLAALKRQAWPDRMSAPEWPAAFRNSRQWCFLSLKPGSDPLKSLVKCFFDAWQYDAVDPERVKQQNGWIELLSAGNGTLENLIEATDRRREEIDQPKPPSFFFYIDQGEELYVRAEERQRRRFSELIAQALSLGRFRAIMSLRSDFLGQLQSDEPLFRAREQIDVAPLREAELREIVCRPPQLLGAKFESEGLVEIITRTTAEDSIKDVGALPLLSYTLDDMWTAMKHRGDGRLRLPAASFELSGVLVARADKFLAGHPGAETALRRILTLRLASVRDDGEPTRRRGARKEFSEDEWRLVSELADYPNRLLATVVTQDSEIYAEVAHEAIFRRWSKLREWLSDEREFLIWRTRLEADRNRWLLDPSAVLMGVPLMRACEWLSTRADDLSMQDQAFINESSNRERSTRQRLRLKFYIALGLALVALAFAASAILKAHVH